MFNSQYSFIALHVLSNYTVIFVANYLVYSDQLFYNYHSIIMIIDTLSCMLKATMICLERRRQNQADCFNASAI